MEQLAYSNLNAKREDTSDVIRGQLKMIDDIIMLPRNIREAKTSKELLEKLNNGAEGATNGME